MIDIKYESQCNQWTLPIMDSSGEIRGFTANVRTKDELIERFYETYPQDEHDFVIAGNPYFDDLPF